MPRTKSLATLIDHYGNDRAFTPRLNKVPLVFNILNRQIFSNKLTEIYFIQCLENNVELI